MSEIDQKIEDLFLNFDDDQSTREKNAAVVEDDYDPIDHDQPDYLKAAAKDENKMNS